MTHLLLWGNAYAQVVRDGKNSVLGLYPLLPENVEIDRTDKGEQRGLSFQSSVPASVYGSGGSCSDRENVSGSVPYLRTGIRHTCSENGVKPCPRVK